MTAKKLKAASMDTILLGKTYIEYIQKFQFHIRPMVALEADEHDEYIKSKPSSKKHKEKFETDEQEEHISKEKSELDGHGLKLMAEINSQEKTETDDQDEPLERALKSRKLKAEQARIDKKNKFDFLNALGSSAAKSVPHNCLFFFDSPESMNLSNMVLSSLMAQCIMNVLKKSHLILTTVATDSSTVQYYEHDEAIDIWSFGIVNYMLSKKNIHGILMVM
ncbi:1912_t:CDS:2 [Entrophospora sp. SA101]|nr:1912_t:CDS:2 [Entrophospora sp. SA101]